MAQMVKSLPAMQDTQVRSLPPSSPPVFLPREFHGHGSLAGYSPWDHKESDMTEQLTLFSLPKPEQILTCGLLKLCFRSCVVPE